MDCCNCDRKTVRDDEQKRKLINRLSRIEGQIRGLKSMIENNAYCNDVLNQTSAVSQAVNAFGKEVLSSHMHTCVAHDIREGRDEVIDELLQTIQKMMR
ncbi:MAG: metal-sensing transcriptional repressor [Sphaerochaetaceae bacterium]|nr:metal-sensing transcriptional repressor [Sphaerochaetaceae bacterium]